VIRGQTAFLTSRRIEDNAFYPVGYAASEEIVRILLAAGSTNQIQARKCAARKMPYEKNSSEP
jgi:hypothetical protein